MPNKAPAETPMIPSICMPFSIKMSNTPAVYSPLIPPPSSTNPIFVYYHLQF